MKKIVLLIVTSFLGSNAIIAQALVSQPGKGNGFELPYSNAVITNRPVTILQKDAEVLAGGSQYSFDGMYLKNLNLNYLDFTKGAHRGTHYEGVNLRNSIGIKKILGDSVNDFTSTTFGSNTMLINTRFINWRIQNSWFTGCTIDSSVFTNTILENTTFSNAKLKNSRFTHSKESFWNNVIFQGGSTATGLIFDKTRLFNTQFGNHTFSYSTIKNSYINNWSCAGMPAAYGKIEGVNFLNDSLLNVNMQFYKISGRDSTTSLCSFEQCFIQNLRLQNCEVGAVFTASTWQLGLVNNTHFLKSVFNDLSVKGGLTPSLRVQFNTCNFSRSSFNGPVVFTNCDFTNCKWPPGPKPAAVQFITCTGTIWQ